MRAPEPPRPRRPHDALWPWRVIACWFALALPLAAAAVVPVDAPSAAAVRAATADAAGVSTLDVAWFMVAGGNRFPSDGRPVPIALPHEWPFDVAADQRTAWYRIGFEPAPAAANGPAALQGVLLRRACGRLLVQVNGATVHADPADAGPADRSCYRARLIAVPEVVMRPAGNVLDIRLDGLPLREVTARQRAGGLAPVEVGPFAELEHRYERDRAWQVTSVQVTGLTLAVVGVFVGAMGWLNRRDVAFVYFGALAVSWAAVTLRVWWSAGIASPFALQWVLASLFAPVAAAASLFLVRFAGPRLPSAERWMLAPCLAMPLTLLAAGATHAFVVAAAWYAVLCAQVAAAAAWCLLSLHRQQRRDLGVMAAVLGIAGLMVVIELGILFGRISLPWLPVGPFGLSLLIIVVAFRLAQGFAEALASAEVGRAQMQDRVAEVTAEIERNFAQLSELRVEQVTEKERKRIAADLHDDLGAKLLTIVHTSESERISTLAREALEEMRLSVRGLTGKPVRVADALADWRVETVGRLGQAGIESDWRSPTEEGEQRLAARTYVQTTRILREATSNIIKHSGASFVKVRCAIGAEDFVLVIQDNGKGISTEMSGKLDRGQGMYSMKNRAKQMQGQCLVESGPGYGTVIRLTLPLNERTTAAPAAS
jgi:two-component system, NarL family, sensor histidine kinase UhpB